LEFVVWLHKTT